MSLLTKAILVFFAGGLGATCRLLVENALKPSGIWLGFSTWVVNSTGCLLIGIFAGILVASSWSNDAKTAFAMLAMTGFCGGYSTFSSFTLDCVKYFEAGHLGIWVIFALATIFVGLFACAFGYWLGQRII